MAISPEERRNKNRDIKAFHQSTLDALNVPNAIVMSKTAYKTGGLSEKHIPFYESELNKNEDIYIEFGDSNMSPEKVDDYPLRGLFKYRKNSQWKDEYPTFDSKYFVPVSELILVTKPEKSMLRTAPEERESKVSELVCNPPDESDPFTREMTIRDYAAIHMRVGCSKKEWLNELIKKWK